MAAPTIRWLCFLLPLLSLLQGTGVRGQLSLGGADSFLPEHLDAAASAVTETGKPLDVNPLADHSGTNAAAAAAPDAAAVAETASDSDLQGASQVDNSLISEATNSPLVETTLPDFDDYTNAETETTTENLRSPENHISHTEEAESSISSHKKQSTEKMGTEALNLTRRIVFTGPEATTAAPQPADQSTRPSSVVRGLDDPSTDFWLPNWPTQLLTNTEEASRRPTVRFPSGLPTVIPDTAAGFLATPTPSYTVTKVPVTQYYFDLASVSPSDVPGPLFDHEDLGVSVSGLPSALPDLTQPLEPQDISSSISDLQSSVLVSPDGPPVSSTPTLPHSVTSAVFATEGPHSVSASSTTQTLPPPSTVLNEVVGGHIVDNTLPENAESEDDIIMKDITEIPEVAPTPMILNHSSTEELDHSENTTVSDDPSGLQLHTDTGETPQPTSTAASATPSPAGPAPPTDSEPVTATSSTTPGSVKPSSVRTSQASKTSRIPLWQLLSQSSPSRPVNSSPPSTLLTPVTVATPLAADSVTPLTSALPQPLSTSIEPPSALDDSPAPIPPTLSPTSPDTKSASELQLSDEFDPSTPLDINDPDQVLTKTLTELENTTVKSTEFNLTDSESTEDPLMHDESLQSNTNQSSSVEGNFSLSLDPNTLMDNNTKDVHTALDDTRTNIFPGNNTSENRTQHENAINADPKEVETDPPLTSAGEEHDSVVDPTEVLVTRLQTVSATWTPVTDTEEGHTESISVPSSISVLTSTTIVSLAPPELLSGFTPIISSTHTPPSFHNEGSGGSHTISSFASTAATTETTTTTSAPAQDFSTLSAPTPTLSAALDIPAVQKTDTTDDPTPTLLPQPVLPEEGEEGTQQEVPEKESALEEVTEAPPPAPTTPIPTTPIMDTTTPMTTDTTTTTTSSTTTTTTTTTTTAPATTEVAITTPEEPTTVSPYNTTTFTSSMPDTSVNGSKAEPGALPTLTTTVVLENGTAVVVVLPYIRALVDYNAQEFCQHKEDFRSMFAEWITRDLNGSVQVKASDIRFFGMAKCHDSPTHQENVASKMENDKDLDGESHMNHTHVFFYVTSEGEADANLTEKFPLFPTDLVISEDLTYLLPRVMQLEMVRPDESSSQDQLQEAAVGTSVIVIIVICSIVGVTILFLLFFFMVVKRRGASNNYYGRRCTPVSMDAYSMDSVSVYHSFRRKSKRRASGRSMKSYLNQAFDDPNGPSRPLNFAKLTHFISDIDGVHEEFATIPVNMPKYDELPPGVEDKNRYANVIPVPETRVLLKVTKDGRNCEYINANFVRGARNESKYYIATQAPLDDTVADFWRMIWEQESRVVVMLTDFVEKGIDKCADYLPPSETLDCHRLYGDFQVTLKSRDMREKFVVSNVQLKNLENNLVREVAHMWFTGWPASGVPNEEAAFISFILEVRRTRKKLRAKGPLVVHCSPGTGRTGTFLASDMVMKQFEEHRTIDVPRTVYTIRRDRAGAVQTKEQYAFIYRVINLYASKLTSGNLESL